MTEHVGAVTAVAGERAAADLPSAIIRLLVDAGLSEGDRISTEAELARTFGVSRQRIREALRHLEALGVLHARRGSGRTVARQSDLLFSMLVAGETPRSASAIINLLNVRHVLELGFVPAVVAAAGSDDVETLRALTTRMRVRAEGGDSFAVEDQDFHLALYAPLRNPLLDGLIRRFWELFTRLDDAGFDHLENALDVVQHHVNIVDAIDRRDAALAQFHMNAHFYDIVKIVSEAVGVREDDEVALPHG